MKTERPATTPDTPAPCEYASLEKTPSKPMRAGRGDRRERVDAVRAGSGRRAQLPAWISLHSFSHSSRVTMPSVASTGGFG
jgi:hypothetical protein